jgi:peptidylprolyl isomerase
MTAAKQGDTVTVHYTGKLEDGTVFDSSRDRCPMQFTIGNGQVIAGFERAAIGMQAGEKKSVDIPVDQAYGPRRDDRIVTMQHSALPLDFTPEVGQRLELTQADDSSLLVTVTDVTDSTLTLDGNHPLAGRNLLFEIELVAIA